MCGSIKISTRGANLVLVEKVFPKIESGEVKPTIYKTLPITEAEAVHDILYKGQNVGKVVLTVR